MAPIEIHTHAAQRMIERGATEDDVRQTVEGGEEFPAKYGRIGFRRNFSYGKDWQGRAFATKQIEAFAVKENEGWLVVTVVVRYF